MRYRAHHSLIEPARQSAHPGRLVAGCILVVVLFIVFALIYAGTVPGLLGHSSGAELIEGKSPVSVLVLLLEFGCLILALSIALQTIHRRTLMSLIGPLALAWAQFRRCVIYLVPLYLLLVIMPMPEAYQLSNNLSLGRWLSWLPLAAFAVMVQIGAEELAFRGYMQSQLAARFTSPLIWIGIPSLLFGALHYSAVVAGDNAWVLVVWACVFGAAAADLTARTGTIGPAIALHFVNNVFAILITAPAGDLDGLSLYTFPLSLDEPGLAMVILPIELTFTLCAWLTARLALRV